jgi:hypothetical protein
MVVPAIAGLLLAGAPAVAAEAAPHAAVGIARAASIRVDTNAWRACAQNFRSAAYAAGSRNFSSASSYASAGTACGRAIFTGSANTLFAQAVTDLQTYIRQGNSSAAVSKANRIAQAIEDCAYAYERGDASARGRF